ncbi:MAG: HAMP domain-containing protein [Telmatospirillum sp.]|nr:HAMP domain-containing protein [Telmatospirillum sp.]
MLNRFLTVKARLLVLVIASTAALIAVAGAGLALNYQRMYEDRVASLRYLTETGYSLAARYEAEERAGRMTREQAQDAFRQDLHALRYGNNEYLFAHTFDVVGFAHPLSPKLIGQNLHDLKDPNGVHIVEEFVKIATTQGAGTIEYLWEREAGKPPVPKLTYVKAFAPWRILIGTGVYIDDLSAHFQTMLWTLLLVIAVLGVPAIVAMAWVAQRLSVAIRGLSDKMRRLAEGDLSVSFPEAKRSDELGAMGAAVLVFKENAEVKQALEARQEEAKRHAEAEKRKAMLNLAQRFETSVGSVIQTVTTEATDMHRRAGELNAAADLTRRLATQVSAATEQTSTNVQTVAAASEELASSIEEIGRQVSASSQVAGQAVGLAGRANDKVAGLAEAAQRIGAVVDLITSIASQTNLLALNATIEAARAGEAGKGFAVVAGEVKNLANQTARATEEIASQIGAIQSVTGEAVKEIEGVSQVIGRIDEIATTIAAAVEEQGAATREISRNVQQAAAGVREVAGNIAEMSGATDRSGALADGVLSASQALGGQIHSLEGEVTEFLGTVRAA